MVHLPVPAVRVSGSFVPGRRHALDAEPPARGLAAGRAVISHLRSVAEAMDRVLAITAAPAGSRAHWIGGDEREELIAEDVEAGLLT